MTDHGSLPMFDASAQRMRSALALEPEFAPEMRSGWRHEAGAPVSIALPPPPPRRQCLLPVVAPADLEFGRVDSARMLPLFCDKARMLREDTTEANSWPSTPVQVVPAGAAHRAVAVAQPEPGRPGNPADRGVALNALTLAAYDEAFACASNAVVTLVFSGGGTQFSVCLGGRSPGNLWLTCGRVHAERGGRKHADAAQRHDDSFG